MADKELDNLRAQLLEKGVTAPKSWNKNKLKKELSKFDEVKAEVPTEPAKVDATEQKPKVAEEAKQEVKQVEAPKETTKTTQPNDVVKVISKTAFSNERLKINNAKKGDEFTVSKEDANFLVVTDRTCAYV